MTQRFVGLILALILAACAGDPTGSPATSSTSPSAAPDASAPPLTPWQEELANVEPDGRRSLQSALTLFATAFGPIPGVAGVTAAERSVGSASPAVRAVTALRDQLSDEQRAAIDGYLAPSADAKTIAIPAAGVTASASRAAAMPPVRLVAAQADDDPLLRDLEQLGIQARRAAAPYFGEIPDRPDGTPALAIRTTYAPSEPFTTFFNPTFGPGGFEKCEVHVNRARVNDGMGAMGRSLTLDVVHCYQSWRMGSEQGFDGNVPAWAWEGPAEYIMLEAWPIQDDDRAYWSVYVRLPDVPLFERSYDAVGAYAQAREAGVDLGSAFVAVLTDVDNPERFALAGLDAGAFLDKWASELLMKARGEWGPAWEFQGPGLNGYWLQAPERSISVANDSTEAFSQEAYTNQLYVLRATADIVRVEVFGRARIGDGTEDVVVFGTADFCITEKGCGPCPDDIEKTIEPAHLAGVAVLAVSGGTDGTNGTVSGHPLEEFCEDRFCPKYKAYVDWAAALPPDTDITQALAAEIARRFDDMYPDAPPEMKPWVDLVFRIYAKFAGVVEPVNIPATGHVAGIEMLPEAFKSMHGHCGIPWAGP